MRMGQLRARARLDPGLHSAVIANAHGFKRGRGWPTAVSLTFWGWMWGIAGVILAVPILAAFKIFCAHIEEMEPIAEFLS